MANKLADARWQGTTAVLWARGSGLSPLDASRGVEEFAAGGHLGGIAAVRIVGDGFDLAWGWRGPHLHHQTRQPPAPGMALGGP